MKKREASYTNLLKNGLKLMPGFLKFIRDIKKQKIMKAIASSSGKDYIKLVMSSLDIKKYFDVIVSGQNIRRGKPYPDIFLKTAKQLRIKPKYCCVLEDSENGVKAAKNANMKVIVIPNKYTKNQDFSNADFIFDSLKKVDWMLISSL